MCVVFFCDNVVSLEFPAIFNLPPNLQSKYFKHKYLLSLIDNHRSVSVIWTIIEFMAHRVKYKTDILKLVSITDHPFRKKR